MSRPNVLAADTAKPVDAVSVCIEGASDTRQTDRVESLIWILRRKYCSLNSFKFSDSVKVYKEKEKTLTMLILLAASVTSSFTLGTVGTNAAYIKYIGVGVSLLTTVVSGVQKVKNYPDQVDRGLKLAEDWRKIANTVNVRLNKMDDPASEGLITEEDAVNAIGDLKCQNISYSFPAIQVVKDTDRSIKWATKLLDSCVALKISGDCTQEKVDRINAKVQRLLDPPAKEGDPDFEEI
uniref:Uncharacterized protein n=1 Tax=viral metagenome TaxID=1070528 RepID=A0A6C0KDQ0_9ZZZZ